MARRLLTYYNRELRHIREMSKEFAQAYPLVAGRLMLGTDECRDPFVERLLEGFAFLAARVHLKLDSEFPSFTQSLLETVCPHYLAPTPSMAMIQFEPSLSEGSLLSGFVIKRETNLRSKGDPLPCIYQTAHDVTLWPIEIVEAQYHTRDLDAFGIRDTRNVRAALRIRLATPAELGFQEVKLDALAFHLRGSDDTPLQLYEQIFAHKAGVLIRPGDRPPKWRLETPPRSVRQVGFDDDQKLLPYGARSFQGYRLLHEYLAFPQRFMFFEVAGLSDAVARCSGNLLDVVVLLSDASPQLENIVNKSNFALYCTPAINLFRMPADRIDVSDRFSEFHVLPDKMRPLDYEVYQVEKVTGYSDALNEGEGQEFRPFYQAGDSDGEASQAFFAVTREPRVPSEHERLHGPRTSTYSGSDVFISLVDGNAAPYRMDLRQLGVQTWCTNRDLSLHMLPSGTMDTDFTVSQAGPWKTIRYLRKTAPRPSIAEEQSPWRVISHLSLNYLSIANTSGGEAADALKSLLRLYADPRDRATQNQIDGIRSVGSRPVIDRVDSPGSSRGDEPMSFARGLEVHVAFDPNAFEGTGFFLLGAVLDRFFSRYVSINSFTRTIVHRWERERTTEVMRWPVRIGQRTIL